MVYTVYQIHLTDTDANDIAKFGWEAAKSNPRVKAYLDKDSDPQAAFDSGYYTRAANIEASDLDEVFEIGNVGPEDLITRFNRMHSVSVGDVIKTPENKYFAVAGIGFTELSN